MEASSQLEGGVRASSRALPCRSLDSSVFVFGNGSRRLSPALTVVTQRSPACEVCAFEAEESVPPLSVGPGDVRCGLCEGPYLPSLSLLTLCDTSPSYP